MGEIHKHGVETEIKTSAGEFYERIKNNLTQLTKIHPEIYKSIDILEGDGKSVGSVILWKYAMGSNNISVVKEKIVAVDDINRSITFQVVEGEVMNVFKSLSLKMDVAAKGDGSVVKWSVEFEKANKDVLDPNPFVDMMAKVTQKVDAHLVKGY